jgi:hypothetical protein
MTTETVTPIEIMSAKVGLFVMGCILLDSYIKMRDTFAANEQKKENEAMMADMDCVELSEAMYHYEKATGKLDPQNSYLR